MNKYYYTVKDETGTYFIGFCYGRADAEERELIEGMQDYCNNKDYELTLLVQVIPMLNMVNQVFPSKCTDESQMCLEGVLKVAM